MNMGVDSSGGDNFSFAGDHLRSRADHHTGRYAAHDVRIAGLANSHNAPAANSDVGFVNSAVVHDHRVGDDQIEDAVRGRCPGGLSHAVTDAFTTAEFRFFAGSGKVFLNFDEQIGVGQTNAVAGRGTVEIGVLASWNFQAHLFVKPKLETSIKNPDRKRA